MIYFLIAFAVFGLDIGTKLLAKACLEGGRSIPLISDVFHLTYVENRGAAFGIMQGGTVFFVIMAVVVAAVVVWLLRSYEQKPPVLKVGLSFLAAGALGNTVDRVFRGYVIDFFDFRLIDFPVFNVADIFVCVGAVVLAVFFVFFEEKYRKGVKENDEG